MMAQWVKACVVQTRGPKMIPGTRIKRGENQLHNVSDLQHVPWNTYTPAYGTHMQ